VQGDVSLVLKSVTSFAGHDEAKLYRSMTTSSASNSPGVFAAAAPASMTDVSHRITGLVGRAVLGIAASDAQQEHRIAELSRL
jgi:hypothetical protein